MIDAQPLTTDIDFGRSFLRFSSERIKHTPRMRIDAACTMIAPDGSAPRTYYLTCPCIAESMYIAENLIHQPVAEFILIARPRVEFLMLKLHASAAIDQRTPLRFNDVMPTKDGLGAKVVQLDVTVRSLPRVERIESYEHFRDALFGNRIINGRTTYTEPDGTTVVLDYPATTINVRHDARDWQVDAGPIVLPSEPRGTLEVSRMNVGFMVFNRWDYAEAVVRDAAPAGDTGAKTNHYHRPVKLRCSHELFASP